MHRPHDLDPDELEEYLWGEEEDELNTPHRARGLLPICVVSWCETAAVVPLFEGGDATFCAAHDPCVVFPTTHPSELAEAVRLFAPHLDRGR